METEDVDIFEKTHAQMEGLYEELSALSKKAPNDAVNKFKIKFINILLEQSGKLLGDTYKPFHDFVIFNIDELPTNSDATLIIGQFLNCMEKFRSDNITISSGVYVWVIDGNPSKIRTYSPKKLKG